MEYYEHTAQQMLSIAQVYIIYAQTCHTYLSAHTYIHTYIYGRHICPQSAPRHFTLFVSFSCFALFIIFAFIYEIA